MSPEEPERLTRALDTREMTARTVTRMRLDLARLAGYIRVLELHEETPKEVTQAIVTLERWTRRLVRKGLAKPPRPAGRRRPHSGSGP